MDKLRDHVYMDLGYLKFVNNFGMKIEWIPQPRATWVAFPGKKKVIKGDDEKSK